MRQRRSTVHTCPAPSVDMRLAITLVSLLTFYPSPHSCQEEDWGLWPVFTPLLGVSSQCLEASQQYMRLLSEALTTTAPLTDRQKNAVQMFDANGRWRNN